MAENSSTRKPRARSASERTVREPRTPRNAESPPPDSDSAQKDTGSTVPPVTGSSTKRTPADRKLAEALTQMYSMVGVAAIGIGMRIGDEGLMGSGYKTAEMAEPISDAWIELANKNPAVKRSLQRLTEASAVGTVVAMHVPIMLPLLASRGIVPPTFGDFAAAATQNGGPAVG